MTQTRPTPGHEPRSAEQPLAPETKPQRGPEHEKLAAFIGYWRGQGTGGAGSKMEFCNACGTVGEALPRIQ